MTTPDMPVDFGPNTHRITRELYSDQALAVLDEQANTRAGELVEAAAVPATTLSTPYPGKTRAECFADISGNNGPIDVATYVAAGHKLLMIKATEGTGYVNYLGQTQHDTAHEHGLNVGRYAWPRPEGGGQDANAQADHFVDTVIDLLEPGDVLMGDQETSYNYSTGQPVQDPADAVWAEFWREFLDRVRERVRPLKFHVPVTLYSANWYVYGKPHLIAYDRTQWIIAAAYDGAVPPANPNGWTIGAHQFTSTASVPGVNGGCDYNAQLLPFPGGGGDNGGDHPSEDDDMELIYDKSTGRRYVVTGGAVRYLTHAQVKAWQAMHGLDAPVPKRHATIVAVARSLRGKHA